MCWFTFSSYQVEIIIQSNKIYPKILGFINLYTFGVICFETCLWDPRHFYRYTFCRCYFFLDSIPQTSALSGCGEQAQKNHTLLQTELMSYDVTEIKKCLRTVTTPIETLVIVRHYGFLVYPIIKKNVNPIVFAPYTIEWLADGLIDRLTDLLIDQFNSILYSLKASLLVFKVHHEYTQMNSKTVKVHMYNSSYNDKNVEFTIQQVVCVCFWPIDWFND